MGTCESHPAPRQNTGLGCHRLNNAWLLCGAPLCDRVRREATKTQRNGAGVVYLSEGNETKVTVEVAVHFRFWGSRTHGVRPNKDGLFVRRHTMSQRFTRALHAVQDYCRETLTEPIPKQWEGLCRKLRGHYTYYGIRGNTDGLQRFHYEVGRVWYRWLRRRSGHAAAVWTWERYNQLLRRMPLSSPKLSAAARA